MRGAIPFGADIDYAVLEKIDGTEPGSETRYSPAQCLGCKVETVTARPIRSTSPPATWSARVRDANDRCERSGRRDGR
jgi:hypothetical protein